MGYGLCKLQMELLLGVDSSKKHVIEPSVISLAFYLNNVLNLWIKQAFLKFIDSFLSLISYRHFFYLLSNLNLHICTLFFRKFSPLKDGLCILVIIKKLKIKIWGGQPSEIIIFWNQRKPLKNQISRLMYFLQDQTRRNPMRRLKCLKEENLQFLKAIC